MKATELSTDDGLTAFYRDVLAPAFADDELISKDELLAGVRAGYTSVYAIRDGDGTVLAGAAAEWSQASRVLLLSYMAVAGSSRGRGLGGQLYQHALSRWLGEYRPCLFVAEVEHPEHHPVSAAHGDPHRRLRFYAAQGAEVLAVPYFQPALRRTSRRVYGMLLLALHVDPEFASSAASSAAGTAAGPAGRSVAGAALRTWFTEYLVETEGGVGEDAATTALLDTFSVDGVPLLPAARYRDAPVAGQP